MIMFLCDVYIIKDITRKMLTCKYLFPINFNSVLRYSVVSRVYFDYVMR